MRGFLFIGTRVASLLKLAMPVLAVVALLLVGMILTRADTNNRRSLLEVSLGMLVFSLFDAVLLLALPRLRLSFGPPEFSVYFLLFVRVGLFLAWVLVFASTVRLTGVPASSILYWLVNIVLTLILIYGFTIEPFSLQVSHLEIPIAQSQLRQPLRIVQLSDLHVERTTRRELEILRRVNELKPDVIVLTGDYLNLSYLSDPQAIHDARDFLSQLHAPYGVFAVNGSVDDQHHMQALFSGLEIALLNNQVHLLQVPGGQITLIGLVDHHESRDPAILRRLTAGIEPDAFTLLLYHPPDLIYEASLVGIDLYLCGHTHGGQIRLPLYGAIVTASAFGKTFEAGKYQLGSTVLYVSRGLGLEGGFAPRVRFLAPPEIVVVDLIPGSAVDLPD